MSLCVWVQAAVFVWTVENLLPTPCQVSIMFSFQNG